MIESNSSKRDFILEGIQEAPLLQHYLGLSAVGMLIFSTLLLLNDHGCGGHQTHYPLCMLFL